MIKNFLSDNVSGISDEILENLAKINHDVEDSYGYDSETKKLKVNLNSLFEKDVCYYPVSSGTAANSIAFSSCVPPYGAVFCTEESHINLDECNAPEFFTGGAKLILIDSIHGKVSPDDLIQKIDNLAPHGFHNPKPTLVSITQSSELGTVYTLDEIKLISDIVRDRNMLLHMDGARIANAVVSLNCSWAEMTWKSGVDILSFGATKNGAFSAEMIVYFKKELSKNVQYYRKRSGHLISKMRFISAQLNSYIENDLWKRNASQANLTAFQLSKSLQKISGLKVVYPVQANGVFVKLPDHLVKKLREKGFKFGIWGDKSKKIYRLMTAFNTTNDSVKNFIENIEKNI